VRHRTAAHVDCDAPRCFATHFDFVETALADIEGDRRLPGSERLLRALDGETVLQLLIVREAGGAAGDKRRDCGGDSEFRHALIAEDGLRFHGSNFAPANWTNNDRASLIHAHSSTLLDGECERAHV
jgi:hypothetical protein